MLDVIVDEYAIRIGLRFAVSFHRTLRIPDDGRIYPLPPGLGMFPLFKIEDYLDCVPSAWREQGGAFIPMYQREALWIGFDAAAWKPNAVKIHVGNINAISGESYDEGLHAGPQDYVVCPDQPWLDGINTGHGSIRQFIAMSLGLGYTVEASITGTERFGGIQIVVFEPKPGKFPEKPPVMPETDSHRLARPKPSFTIAQPMGLGAGGTMKQKIYPDVYGLDAWDQDNYGCVVIHIVNSAQFFEITGKKPPPTPVDPKTYTEHGLPWFDLYDEARGDIAPSERLTEIKTVDERDRERGESTASNRSVDVPETQIKKLHIDDFCTKNRTSSLSDSKKHSSERE